MSSIIVHTCVNIFNTVICIRRMCKTTGVICAQVNRNILIGRKRKKKKVPAHAVSFLYSHHSPITHFITSHILPNAYWAILRFYINAHKDDSSTTDNILKESYAHPTFNRLFLVNPTKK